MNVGFVSTFYNEVYGGAEISTRLLVKNLNEQNIKTKTFTPHSGFSKKDDLILLSGLALIPKKIFILGSFLSDKLFAHMLYKKLLEEKINILHVQDLFALPATFLCAQRLRIPIIVTVRDNLPREFFVKNINIFALRNKTYKAILQKCDGIIAISEHIRQKLISFGIWVDKIKVIYNLLPEVEGRSKLVPINDNIRFLVAGRLEKEKGFDIALKAFAIARTQCENITLEIVGAGPESSSLRKFACILKVDNHVAFLGKVSHESLLQRYAQADVVLIPSVYEEPLGRIALEAGRVGKPVIASRIGGLPEIIDHGKAGYLVEATNHDEMAKKIIILAKDKELRKKMGDHNRDFVTKKFNTQKILAQTINYYQTLLNKY